MTVGFWTGVVALHIAPPAGLFAMAHGQTPVLAPDEETWLWTLEHGSYSAILAGKTQNNGSTQWRMSVDGPGFEDFLWFEGTSSEMGSEGQWTIHQLETASPAYTFDYDLTTTTGNVKATVVDAGSEHIGNYVSWSVDSAQQRFTVHAASESKSWIVAWNPDSGSGSIIGPSGEMKCWAGREAAYADTDCSLLL